MVWVRRFYGNAVLCGGRVFAEHFACNVLFASVRRTTRLDHIVHHLGLALGGRPAASFARKPFQRGRDVGARAPPGLTKQIGDRLPVAQATSIAT